jgi:hypothetical protein
MEDLEDEVKEQFPNLPLSAQNAIIRDRAKGIQKSRRTAVADYNSALAEYQDAKDELSMELDIAKIEDDSNKEKYLLALDMYETRRGEMREDEKIAFQEESKIRSENRAKSWELEMKEIDKKMRIEAEQRADSRKITYQTDRMGRMMAIQGGKATLVKDTDGQVVLTENYKDYDEQVLKNSDGTYTAVRTFNDGRPPQFIPYDSEGSPVNGGAKIYDAVAKARVTGQCGEGVNDYLQNLGAGRKFGNSYKQKQSIINVSVQEGDNPPVGGVAIWNPPKIQGVHEYGHVGIVTGYNPETGMVNIHDWNFNGKQQQNDHQVPISQIIGTGGGFYNPAKDKPDLMLGTQTANEKKTKGQEIAETIMNGTGKISDYTPTQRATFLPILDEMKNKALGSGDLIGVMKASAGGKTPSNDFKKSLQKASTVVDSIGTLVNTLSMDEITDSEGNTFDISPLTGWINSKDPWNTDAQVVNTTLTSIIPNLARGVYGEVGVLTDQDAELYRKTLPNLRQTEDVQKAVTAMTLRVVRNSIESRIDIEASGDTDMSGYVRFYNKLNDKINEIDDSIGVGKDITPTENIKFGFYTSQEDVLFDDVLNRT